MVTEYPAGPVALPTAISWANHLFGVAVFLAPEYNTEEIRQTILMTTRVRVALWYQRICNNLPEYAMYLPANIKAIHIEVDKATAWNQKESIGLVFSPTTKEFPVGIKMRLVPEISTSIDFKACLKAKQCQELQACFLEISDTRTLCVTLHPEYNKHHTMATLQWFLCTTPCQLHQNVTCSMLLVHPHNQTNLLWGSYPSIKQKLTKSFLDLCRNFWVFM